MKDLILKWWNREWSNWEYDGDNSVFENYRTELPIAINKIYKRTSNDGLVQYKKIKRI